MAGSSSITGNQTVTFTDNMSFDGTDRGGAMTTDGQLWIGATASNRANDGGHVRLGSITSSDGSINVVNGPGSIDIRGQAQGFQPNAVLQEFDDFLGSNSAVSGASKLAWSFILSNNGMTDGTSDHPGIYQTGTSQANAGIYLGTTSNGPIVLGGGTTTLTWIVQLPTLSTGGNSYNYYCGFADATTLGGFDDLFVNGLYFKYNHALNGGQWTINSTRASVTTSVSTASVVTTSWTTLSIVINAGNTSASFYVNNVLVGTAITTNLPTVAICPFIGIYNLAGTNPITLFDLFYIVITLSNPRPGPTNPAITGSNGRLLLSYTATPISYQVLGTDAIIGVTSTAAARTITMPNASLTTGQQWEIKDESGAAATNNITVSGNGFNIDGAATYVINTNYGSVSIYWSGTNYFLV